MNKANYVDENLFHWCVGSAQFSILQLLLEGLEKTILNYTNWYCCLNE